MVRNISKPTFSWDILHCWNLDRKAFISMMAGVPEMMPQLMMLCTWYTWMCDQIYCEPVSIGIRMACFESSGRLEHSAKALRDRLNGYPKKTLVDFVGIKWEVAGPRFTECLSRRMLDVMGKLQVRVPMTSLSPSTVESRSTDKYPY